MACQRAASSRNIAYPPELLSLRGALSRIRECSHLHKQAVVIEIDLVNALIVHRLWSPPERTWTARGWSYGPQYWNPSQDAAVCFCGTNIDAWHRYCWVMDVARQAPSGAGSDRHSLHVRGLEEELARYPHVLAGMSPWLHDAETPHLQSDGKGSRLYRKAC